jgi:hypothetical protein
MITNASDNSDVLKCLGGAFTRAFFGLVILSVEVSKSIVLDFNLNYFAEDEA